LGRLAMDRFADGSKRLCERSNVVMRRHVPCFEMHLRNPTEISRDEAVEDLGQETALLLANPAHNAEINRDDGTILLDEEVAGMHVGVEEAIAQCVAQKGLDERDGKAFEVMAGSAKTFDVRHFDA